MNLEQAFDWGAWWMWISLWGTLARVLIMALDEGRRK